MRVPLACWECSNKEAEEFILREYNDTGKYFHTCKNGHKSVLLLENHRFELLFSMGMHAIKRGFYREGVANFASSLERFQEFMIKTLSIKSGMNLDAVDRVWKLVAAQSERQLGAYIFLHSQEFCEEPALAVLNSKDVKFRNNVIHKGKIPTKKEAINLGKNVMELIRPVIAWLKEDYYEFYFVIEEQYKNSLKGDITADTNISTLRIPTVLGLEDFVKLKGNYDLEVEISLISDTFY